VKVFVAGATGAIGRPLIESLTLAGHTTCGMVRSQDSSTSLSNLGIGIFYDPSPGSLFDFSGNPPLLNSYTIVGDNITPNETTSLFNDAKASNAAFVSGFNAGQTLAQIQHADPNFSPPAINVLMSPPGGCSRLSIRDGASNCSRPLALALRSASATSAITESRSLRAIILRMLIATQLSLLSQTAEPIHASVSRLTFHCQCRIRASVSY
jgi:hypothetical protein